MFWKRLHHETETIKIEANKFAQMQKLQRWLDEPISVDLSTEDIKKTQSLLTTLIGDRYTNSELRKLKASDNKAKWESVKSFQTLTYLTRSYLESQVNLDKICRNFHFERQSLKLENEEKISINEYEKLYDLARANEYVEIFDQLKLIKGNKVLERFYEHTKLARKIVDYFEREFDRIFRFPTGSIVFKHTWSKSKPDAELGGLFYKLYYFFGNYFNKFQHASQGFTISQNKIAHIYPNFEIIPFGLRDFLQNQIFQIKLDQLINKENKVFLNKNLGNEWLKILEKKYIQILLQTYKIIQNKHQGLCVPSGIGEVIRRIRIFFTCFWGYKNWFIRDHDNKDIRDNLLRKGKWINHKKGVQLICSEFIGLLIIATIQELDDEIKKTLHHRGVEAIPTKIIKSPLSQKENLYLLTPTRLLKAMRERNAIEKVSYILPKINAGIFAPQVEKSFQIIASKKVLEERERCLNTNFSLVSA